MNVDTQIATLVKSSLGLAVSLTRRGCIIFNTGSIWRTLTLQPPSLHLHFPPDPPYVAMLLDCGGQPPQTWHDDLCGFIETMFQRRVDGLKPASTLARQRAFRLSPGPRPSFGGELGWPNYGSNRLGRSVYGPYPFLWCNRGVAVAV